MTNNELRVFEACISQVNSEQELETKRVFQLTVDDAQDLFYSGKSIQNAYRDLAAAANRLFEREARIKLSGGDTLRTRFVDYVKFMPEKRCIELSFANYIIPYISQLKGSFTSYKLKYTAQFSNVNSHRLYHLAVMWLGQNKHSPIEIEIDEVREMLGIADKYRSFAMFRKKVIEPAVQEINQYSDCSIDVAFKRFGRKFKWLQISFSRSKAAQKELEDARKAHEERKLEFAEKAEQSAFNQQMKHMREEAEQLDMFKKDKQAKFNELRKIYDAVPVGAYLIDPRGKEWLKEKEGLYCASERSGMPLADAIRVIKKLKVKE